MHGRCRRLSLLTAAALLHLAGAARAQTPDTLALTPPLQDLPPRVVVDASCALTRLVQAPRPSDESVRDAIEALYRTSARRHDAGTFDWLIYPPGPADGSQLPGGEGGAPAAVFFDGRRVVEDDHLYDAETLRLTAIVPRPDSAMGWLASARAATAVRRESSLLARGFPAALAEVLALAAAREDAPGRPCGRYTVFTHVTPVEFPDATVVARVELQAAAGLAETPAFADEFDRVRVEIEALYLGYTGLHVVFDAIAAALRGSECGSQRSGPCLLAARRAAVDAVLGLQPTAEHTIRALREGTSLALSRLEQRAGQRAFAAVETFRVVRRPWIGFSVGGLLVEEAGDKLEFEVEEGRVVADGVESDGFKSLVLLDLYLRPVDIGDPAPGVVPHASVGFAIGEALEPGVFLASTLPFTGGRLSPFAGGLLRRETEDASGAGGEPAVDVDRRVRWVAGLKVGLPVVP
ncbi:MAG: hypothetical protein ABR599_06675 [Gemmatimonadota bacterium]